MQRHAAPSAPWPWTDPSDEIPSDQLQTNLPPVPPPCDHTACDGCWKGYPQSKFPNWTPEQVKRSKIDHAVRNYARDKAATIYIVDVDDNGHFSIPSDNRNVITVSENGYLQFWSDFTTLTPDPLHSLHRPNHIRVRIFFIQDITGPVLQMFGAKYNIEPFFWSSALHRIPSRYQENPKPREGDHVTITLTFVKATDIPEDEIQASTEPARYTSDEASSIVLTNRIDTQAPLDLKSSQRRLIMDQLCVHLIRHVEGSTIVFFQPNQNSTTTAKYLQERIRFAGRSVYWQNIFRRSHDPSFVLMTFLWHCLYAWDEALEVLYAHICYLETEVITTSDIHLTEELHVIRAHHLHYANLLEDFRKAVVFLRDTHNPAMDNVQSADTASGSKRDLEKECYNLMSEIERLEMERRMQDKRLKNVMNLVFSSVNIKDSKRMQKMTEAAVRDSAAMKQIAYLTMIFLPASFVAAVFGMNVVEIDPETVGRLGHYIATTVPLTLITIYAVIAFQSQFYLLKGHSLWSRLVWPFSMTKKLFVGNKRTTELSNGSLPLTNMNR